MADEKVKAENWIVLSLENIGTIDSSTVDLFNPNVDYSGSTRYITGVLTFASGSGAIINTSQNGYEVVDGTYNSIQELISALNAQFTENGNGVFTYVYLGAENYRLVAFSTIWTFLDITTPANPNAKFTASLSNVVAGSTGVVQSEYTPSLNDITQELVYQPYVLVDVDIFANSRPQVNKNLSLIERDPNGKELTRLEFPKLSPNASQSVILSQPLRYQPTPTNNLEYTLLAGETVRLIFKYIGGNLSELVVPESTSDIYIEEIKHNLLPKPKKPMKYLPITNPMLRLTRRTKIKSAKNFKIIEDYMEENRGDAVPVEEIKTAFRDTDYRSSKG